MKARHTFLIVHRMDNTCKLNLHGYNRASIISITLLSN